VGPGHAGQDTKEPGVLAYYEVAQLTDTTSMVTYCNLFVHFIVDLHNFRSTSVGNDLDQTNYKLEVCALCGEADPRRVCRELHSKGSS